MLKVAIIGSKGMPARSGGVEQHVEQLAYGLSAKGFNVLVYTRPWYTGSWKRHRDHGVNLIPLPSIPTKHLDAISHTIVASIDVLFRRVDIIHVHGIGPSLLLPWLRLTTNARIVTTFHSQDYHHQKWGWFARLSLRIGQWVACHWSHETIVISKELERFVWTAYQKTATYIPNGTRIPKLAGISEEPLRQWGLEKNKYILCVGRLVRHKGVQYLIDAYKRLETNYPLVIVGASAHTNDYVHYLHRLARGNRYIYFVGEQTGKALEALYRHAATVVQPSESEGVSLVLLEAMSYARPVVVSNIPGNREVVGDYSLVFRRANSLDLARKLQWVIDHPRQARSLGVLNRELVKKYYRWEQITNSTIELYKKTILEAAPKAFRSPQIVRGVSRLS